MNVKSFYQGPIPTLEKLEKAIYIIAGGLLVVAAFAMLGKAVLSLWTAFSISTPRETALRLLDDLLLVLMLVEILHTILVSLKTHVIKTEPFLAVGLIAAVRRILIITVEAAHIADLSDVVFQRTMIEISILTISILILVFSIYLVRKKAPETVETVSSFQ